MIDEEEEKFRKKYPKISEEIEKEKTNIPITRIRSKEAEEESGDKSLFDELRNPDVISFIRRAENSDQANEIIDYCLEKGEIDEEYANKLKLQLALYGVRSFGSKKEPGYYEKKFRKKQKKKT
jgi:hypothetical protein